MKRMMFLAMMLATVAALQTGCHKANENKGKSVKAQRPSPCKAGMILISAGEVTMGCAGGKNCFDDEKPQKKVSVDAFCIDATEVTQRAYQSAMAANPANFKNCGADCPVELVTWDQAKSFCEKTGKRLPSEAEWERAARGNTATQFPWGASFSEKNAWLAANAGGATHQVKKTKPNVFGLYDIIGNVSEWTQDCYDPTWYAKMPARNPINTAPDCKYRTVRGGSWNSSADSASVWDRSGFNIATPFIGFRCAKDKDKD
jgi:formylglycine-generating enzyme